MARIELLTFPRIFGQVFNPISVYRCFDAGGRMVMAVYEVRNTFGDMHSYIGVDDGLHEASKVFHVSPFFPVAGEYRLRIRQQGQKLSLAIRYEMEGAAALTATLRGEIRPVSALGIISTMLKMRLWPMRPLRLHSLGGIQALAQKGTVLPPPATTGNRLDTCDQ